MMRRVRGSIILAMMVVMSMGMLSGCKSVEEYVGMETVIESSTRRPPKWVKNPPKPNRNYYFFVGQEESKRQSDRYAYQRALSEISTFLNTRATTLYTQREQHDGHDVLSQYREEYIKNVSQSSIRGAIRKDRYWEKIKVSLENGADRFYRHYVLVAIHKGDIEESEKRTLEKQLQDVGDNAEAHQELMVINERLNTGH